MTSKEKISFAFHFVCILCTFFLVGRSIYLYLLDDDTTQVEYNQFMSDNGTRYPSVSFCLRWPILQTDDPWKKLLNSTRRTKNQIKKLRRKYRKFVDGQLFSKKFAEADYDDLTLDLNKYVKSYTIRMDGDKWIKWKFRNNSYRITHAYAIDHSHPENNSKIDMTDDFLTRIDGLNTYVSHRRFTQKCFTFDTPWIPDGKIEMIEIRINPKVFQQQDDTIPLSSRKFSIHFHYPYQKMTSLTQPNGWESRLSKSAKYYLRKHYIGNVEVLRRRNKRNNPCIDGNYDDQITLRAAQKVGCKHPINKLNTYYRNCNTKEEIKAFNHELYDVDPTIKYWPPCRSVMSLSEWQGEESQLCNTYCQQNLRGKTRKRQEEERKSCMTQCQENLGLGIQVIFNDYVFREVIYSKFITVESLVGNSGGYIGKN